MSGTKEKIGILGGTFDPIHMGHLIIAEQARDQYSLDRVLLIPSGHSYFKDNREQKVLSGQMRLEMTRIAAEGYAPFRRHARSCGVQRHCEYGWHGAADRCDPHPGRGPAGGLLGRRRDRQEIRIILSRCVIQIPERSARGLRIAGVSSRSVTGGRKRCMN